MQLSRQKGLVWAVLALGLMGGCGSSGKGSGTDDEDSGTGEDAGRDDAGRADSGGLDAEIDADGECIPKGCDELGYECGAADDGCGGALDCGATCADLATCGGGGVPNKCGCTPKTCATIGTVEQQSCGATVPDGCGGTIPGGCGDCEGKTGDGWDCNTTTSICECSPKGQTQACAEAGRVCGEVPDGCGGTPYNCGTCGAGKSCSAAGTCACDAAYAPTACNGKTCGTVTIDGCEYACGPACTACTSPVTNCATCACDAGNVCKPGVLTCCAPATPAERLTLCANRGCDETVTDPCTGASISCGCAAGQGCVDKAYIEGATKSSCLPTAEAAIVGGYVTRTHQFTKFFGSEVEKAETVSLVTISKKANGTLQMVDKGCVATTTRNASVAPAFVNMPWAVVPLTLSGNSWTRGEISPTPPIGFEPSMPSFCAATPGGVPSAGADYDPEPSDLDTSPMPSSGSQKAWLLGNKTCTCPSAAQVCTRSTMTRTCIPRQNLDVPSKATDCRLNDPDRDGRPGYTVIPAATGRPVTAASVGPSKWAGAVQANGFHSGRVTEPSPFFRNFTSCGDNGSPSGACNLLALAGESQTCGSDGPKFNRVHFSKVPPKDFAMLTCEAFYNRSLTGAGGVTSAAQWSDVETAVNSTAINSYFRGDRGPACSAPGDCAEGSICTGGKCWPMTTPGACTATSQCTSNEANLARGVSWTCVNPGAQGYCAPASCPAPPPPP